MSDNNETASQDPTEKAESIFLDMLTPEEEKQAEPGQETEQEESEETEVETEVEAEAETDEEIEEESDERSEEDEVEDESEEEPESFSIKVDGEDIQVTLDELKAGYSRQKDYTRKTQEVAEQRKEAEKIQNEAMQKNTELSEERALYNDLLPKMQMMIKNNLQKEPDWQQLIDQDPQEYLRKKEEWNKTSQTLTFVENEMNRLRTEQEQDSQRALQQQALEGQRIINEKIPEWKDNEVAKKEAENMMTYAKGLGFTQDELSQIYDGRLILLLRDAWQHSKVKKAVKTKPKESPARVSKPGNSNKIRSNTPLKNAKSRLRKSGTVSDAAKVFEQLL
tara:strand:- start:1888 stop:2895 length:1008 start_codon:yes stop_codon:yes gene_type:complete